MAHRSDHGHAVHGIAVGLLALCAVLHYGWALAPPENQADVWNATGAATRAALVIAIAMRYRSAILWVVCAFWVAEEAMVAGCSALFIFSPWAVAPGSAQCSALLTFDLGKIGALALVCIAVAYIKSSDTDT